ncbi:MAG: hypothetical protein GY913_32765 [Proteobacteria bacterium]|nr:hypothetical protein [Pseudomonadota bacterium]MCP4921696.1 hypothetical protein [Pseudomonadota bacterium]
MILSIVAVATASQPAIPVQSVAIDAGLAATQLEMQGLIEHDRESLAQSRAIYEALARIEQDADARAQAQLSAAGVAQAMGDVASAMVHLTAVEQSGPARYQAEATARKSEIY